MLLSRGRKRDVMASDPVTPSQLCSILNLWPAASSKKQKKKNSLLQEDVRIASSGSWRYDCAQTLKPFLIMTKAKQNKKKVQRVYIRVLGNRRSKAYLRPRAAYYTRTTEHCGVDFRSRGRFPCVGGTPCAGITSKTTKEKDLAPLLLHLSSC